MAAREVLDLARLWQRIDALDGNVGGNAQLRLYEATCNLLNAQTRWFLRQGPGHGRRSRRHVERHKTGLAALTQALESVLPPGRKSRLERRGGELRPTASRPTLPATLRGSMCWRTRRPITEIAHAPWAAGAKTARVLFEIGERLAHRRSDARGAAIATADEYDRLAIAHVLAPAGGGAAQPSRARPSGPADRRPGPRARATVSAACERTLEEAAGQGTLTVSRLSVAAGALTSSPPALAEVRSHVTPSPAALRRLYDSRHCEFPATSLAAIL